MTQLHALVVYVPESHAEALLEAIGEAGAGRIGNYSHCSFVAPGTGRFTPLAGAEPFVGTVGSGERAPELRVACVVEEEMLDAYARLFAWKLSLHGLWRVHGGSLLFPHRAADCRPGLVGFLRDCYNHRPVPQIPSGLLR